MILSLVGGLLTFLGQGAYATVSQAHDVIGGNA
jgi:hypothetical protein